MYALVIEHAGGLAAATPLVARWRHRELVARLPGYRRRLELQADGYRRLVEVFLSAAPEDVAAALDEPVRRRCEADHLGDAVAELGLLVRAGDALGAPAVLLWRSRATSANGGQVCWRDHLQQAAPMVDLW
jgi:hypothetical protein